MRTRFRVHDGLELSAGSGEAQQERDWGTVVRGNNY